MVALNRRTSPLFFTNSLLINGWTGEVHVVVVASAHSLLKWSCETSGWAKLCLGRFTSTSLRTKLATKLGQSSRDHPFFSLTGETNYRGRVSRPSSQDKKGNKTRVTLKHSRATLPAAANLLATTTRVAAVMSRLESERFLLARSLRSRLLMMGSIRT